MLGRQLRRHAINTFVLQQDEMDCGVACLASIINYYGGYVQLEKLRLASGANPSGTTMLGLLQAANKHCLSGDAFEGTIDELKALDNPTLLHVVINDVQEHFVVCYGLVNNKFLIGNPSFGVHEVSENELDRMWLTKALLVLKPEDNFVKGEKDIHLKFKWLWKILKTDRNLLTSATLVGFVISTLAFVTTIFTEKLVDELIRSATASTLILGLVCWFILLLLRTILVYLREVALMKQTLKFNTNIFGDFLSHLISLPMNYFHNRRKGDMISRFYDNEKVQHNTQALVSESSLDAFTLFVSIAIMAFYHSSIFVYLMILAPIHFLIVFNYHKKIYKSNIELLLAQANNESKFIDTISGVLTIKQFNREYLFVNDLIGSYNAFQVTSFKLSILNSRFRILVEFFGLFALLFIISITVNDVLIRKIQVGDMIAIIAVASIAFSSTSKLANSLMYFQEAMAALDRTHEIISLEKEALGVESIDSFSITIRNASYGFPGYSNLLSNVDCTFSLGKVYLITGSNGSGKSTLLKLLQGYVCPNEGSVLIGSKLVQDIEKEELRSLFGNVPQEVKIFNNSLLYNVAFTNSPELGYFDVFVNKYGFRDFFKSFPNGLDTLLGEEGVKVSGGQRQLIAFARALYHNPKYLLLDEFTSSMDEDTKGFAIDLIVKAKTSSGIIIVSHENYFEEIADSIYSITNNSLIKMKFNEF